MKTIYIYHEYGAPTHYHALKYLAESNGYAVKYFTFNRILQANMFDILKCLAKRPIQTLNNLFFFLSLPLRKKSKIVIGIAPFNNRLPLLMRFMQKHEVYYHTSYSCWDGSRYAHNPKSDQMIETWRYFTSQYVKHIFAVSEWTKKQLIQNSFSINNKISVVNHSYTKLVNVEAKKNKNLNFICVGDLGERKGVSELLEIFKSRPEITITFVGKGSLEGKVVEYSSIYSNIKYAGFINGSDKILPLYKEHSFLILNSHRTSTWEELFGMVIIEGMSAGCVPITTDHPGPKEIISNGINGIICSEGRIAEGIQNAICMDEKAYVAMRAAAIEKGNSYYFKKLADKWNAILS